MLDKAPENMVAFRKQFEMTTLPQHATLHLFADVGYMLWVNGRYVERGPARFEPAAPEYDSVDITTFMCAGSNLISILVMGTSGESSIFQSLDDHRLLLGYPFRRLDLFLCRGEPPAGK